MKKKLVGMVLVVCMAAAVFSGCGKKSDKSSKSNDVNDMLESVLDGVKDEKVELCDYKGMKIDVTKQQAITDDDVTKSINEWMQYYPAVFEGEVVSGQTANIDYTGTIDGKEFSGGSGTAYDLVIGSGKFIPGFEEQLIDKKVGDKCTVDVTFPEGYENTDVAGKAAKFEVTINHIENKDAVKVCDEWIKYVAGKENVAKDDLSEYKEDAFKKFIKKNLETQQANARKSEVAQATTSKLSEECKFDNVSKKTKDKYIEDEKKYNESSVTNYGYSSVAEYISEAGISQEEYDEKIETDAISYMKTILALKTIALKEKIKVTEKEYEDFLSSYATQYGFETVKEFEEKYADTYGTDLFESKLIEKVLQFLQDKAKLNEIEATPAPAAAQ